MDPIHRIIYPLGPIHQVCANFANWVFGAGVATKGQRQNRFNIAKQAMENDQANLLVRAWVPELAKVSAAALLFPLLLPLLFLLLFSAHVSAPIFARVSALVFAFSFASTCAHRAILTRAYVC
jgi:hypothetical protein